ncbi:MAG: exopolysaccharide biosynthesis operon protein EpsL [Rhodocyclaceae bacterium]|nr:exopolysaccharide biosynthesis operon protein EpsL [Rhodocyclaceae bacterium]
MVRLPRRFLLALPLVAVLSAHADEMDVFNFRAAVSTLRDDNLFRVPSALNPQMDTITTTIAGVDFDKRISLQELIAHVSWVDTHYSSNSYLNAGNLHYDAKWLWAVGTHLHGELAADRSSAQNSFADFQGLRERNLRTTENQRFGLDYAFHPSWHALGGLSHQTVTNDRLLTQESDFEANSAILGIKYTPASGNWLSFQTRQTEGDYNKRPFDAASQFDNRFTETGQEFAMTWQPTGHSTFNGRLEYVERRHPHFSSRNFSGWTGQLGYLYQYSAKTALTAAYVRAINAFQDTNSSYYVSDDLTLGSRWDATDKISLAARLGYAQRHYQGEIAPLATPQRQDDVTRAGVDLSYKPARWLEFKAGVAAEKRNSNSGGFDYTDRQLLFSVSARI